MTTETVHTGAPHTHESPWKAADLRGRYPDEISPELFLRIGKALGTHLNADAYVLVAGDFRLSTFELRESLIQGLMSTGARVLDAGQIPTPIGYFAASQYNPNAVLVVTASHNPPEDNGLKLLLEGRPPTPVQLREIRRIAEGQEFRSGFGSCTTIDPLLGYEKFILQRWQHLTPELLPSVVLDAGNGAWSEIAPRLFSALHFQVLCLSCKIDGSFPDRPSDCSRPSNLRGLSALVREQGNAIGIAWDGDGDRVALVDENGYAISADELSMLITRELFDPENSHPTTRGNDVVIDLKIASAAQREVERLGGVTRLERTGHAFMRTRMIETNARLGLDACGHFFFGELHGADDGLFAALTILYLLQRTRVSLSQLLKTLPVNYGSPEFRIPLALLSFDDARETLLSAFPEAHIDRLDGIRLSLPEGIVLFRQSGTEPVLSLRIEGFTAAKYEDLLERILNLLPAANASIQTQLREHALPSHV